MKLYYAPGACSLAVHIVLREAGYKFELDRVDFGAEKTAGGEYFFKVNPKGYVPALKLNDGQVLTEAAVISQYLADQKPESGLAPEAGTMERYHLLEWLNFISAEIHKSFGPLWRPNTPEQTRQDQKDLLGKRFDYIAEQLKDKQYLSGDKFTVADAYLFTVLNWTGLLKMDLSKWPILETYMSRIAARVPVQEALKAEGLAPVTAAAD